MDEGIEESEKVNIDISIDEARAMQMAVVESLTMYEDVIMADQLDDEAYVQAVELAMIYRKCLHSLDVENENLLNVYLGSRKESLPDNVIDFEKVLKQKGIVTDGDVSED